MATSREPRPADNRIQLKLVRPRRMRIREREGQDEIDFLFSSDDHSRPLDSFASPMAECDGAGRRNVSNFSSSAAKETSWLRWLPGLVILRSYEPAWLTHDLVAGIVLTTMLAPVGIAYAVASGVGAIYGLYATIACLLAYALFGPSRILVLGPRPPPWRPSYPRGHCSPTVGGAIRASRDRTRRRDGACLRGDPHHCRAHSARFRNRASVEADPLWVHEWNRADSLDQSAAQAARLEDRQHGTFEGSLVNRRRGRWGARSMGWSSRSEPPPLQ